MNTTTGLKISIDILMTLTLFFLMAHSLVGEKAHQWAGCLMFALFAVHHLLNVRWSAAILKGRYTPFRVFQTTLVLLILLDMLSLMLSGIILSKYLFTFFEIKNLTAYARTMHLLGSYWGFALMSVHLGLHWSKIAAITAPYLKQRLRQNPFAALIIKAAAVLPGLYGFFALFKCGIASYMFYQNQFVFFDFAEPLIFFFADYVAVMWFFVLAAHYSAKGLKRAGRTPSTGKNPPD